MAVVGLLLAACQCSVGPAVVRTFVAAMLFLSELLCGFPPFFLCCLSAAKLVSTFQNWTKIMLQGLVVPLLKHFFF